MADQVRVSPQQGADSWKAGLAGAGAKYTTGVQNVKVAPGQKAAAAKDSWVYKMTLPETADKFARKVGAVTLQSWQAAATSIGAQRLSQGATKGAPKMATFAASFYPYLNTGLQQIAGMPNVTLEDKIARATAMMRYNAQYKAQ